MMSLFGQLIYLRIQPWIYGSWNGKFLIPEKIVGTWVICTRIEFEEIYFR